HQGLSHVVGYALPLAHNGFTFYSGSWFLRHQHCFLIPGDSPMGFRLPLDSILWEKAGDRLEDYPVDPTVKLPPLPSREQLARREATRPPISYQSRFPSAHKLGSRGPGAPGNGTRSSEGLPSDGTTPGAFP